MLAAVSASISTPVGPVVAASARTRRTPPERSGVTATTRSVRARGWQSGISSLVRLPPMTPASSATPRTSPLRPPPPITALIGSSDTATSASEIALRTTAVDHEAHLLIGHGDFGLGDRTAGGIRLVRDVDHPRPTGPVDVGQAATLGARRQVLGHRLSSIGSRGPCPRGGTATA